MHYIIIKNAEAVKPKFFGKFDWTSDRTEAVRFEHLNQTRQVIKNLNCKTAQAIPE